VSYDQENVINCSLRAVMYNNKSVGRFLVETVVTDGICQIFVVKFWQPV
jgi:hypothetical protein